MLFEEIAKTTRKMLKVYQNRKWYSKVTENVSKMDKWPHYIKNERGGNSFPVENTDFPFFAEFIGVTSVNKLRRRQVYNSITHHLNSIVSVYNPSSSPSSPFIPFTLSYLPRPLPLRSSPGNLGSRMRDGHALACQPSMKAWFTHRWRGVHREMFVCSDFRWRNLYLRRTHLSTRVGRARSIPLTAWK